MPRAVECRCCWLRAELAKCSARTWRVELHTPAHDRQTGRARCLVSSSQSVSGCCAVSHTWHVGQQEAGSLLAKSKALLQGDQLAQIPTRSVLAPRMVDKHDYAPKAPKAQKSPRASWSRVDSDQHPAFSTHAAGEVSVDWFLLFSCARSSCFLARARRPSCACRACNVGAPAIATGGYALRAGAADVLLQADSGPRVPQSSFTKSLVQEFEVVSRPQSYPRRHSRQMDDPRASQRVSVEAAAAAAGMNASMSMSSSKSGVTRRVDYVPGSGTWGFQVHLPSKKEALENARRHSPLAISKSGVAQTRPASFPPPQARSVARTSWLEAGVSGDENLIQRIQCAGTPRGVDRVALRGIA